jgi:GNAT superfamily N-acetyltransferase
MEIRPATPADLPTIQRIAHQTWPATFGDILSPTQIAYMLDWMYGLPALTEQIEQRGHRFLLAVEGDAALGYLSYELNYRTEPVTKIHKLYVLPEAQGRGLGQALVGQAAEAARAAGNGALVLNVNRQNRAVQFYERLGFDLVQTEDIDIGNGYRMEDFVLQKSL